jgi:hypothetical protein
LARHEGRTSTFVPFSRGYSLASDAPAHRREGLIHANERAFVFRAGNRFPIPHTDCWRADIPSGNWRNARQVPAR